MFLCTLALVVLFAKTVISAQHSLLETVWKHLPRYHNYLQHDAQEFFTQFLERIDGEFRSEQRLCHGQHPVASRSESPKRRGGKKSKIFFLSFLLLLF